MNPDRLAELEEERRFLLGSIADLDREHDVGDVDEHDYVVLRDGYTARAATVLRAIDQGSEALPGARRTRRSVTAAWAIGVLIVASVAGWGVARWSGQRTPGQTMTGGVAVDDVTAKLAEARALIATDPQRTAELYREVLDVDPDNAEARTYTSWLLALSAGGASEATAALALEQAQVGFEAVTASSPDYADAHCLYAVMAVRLLPEPNVELARTQGEACLANDPPAEMVALVQPFLDSLPAPDTVSTGG